MPPQQPAAPAAPAAPRSPVTGTAASRSLFAPPEAARPISLWGSSSMSSEGGQESTPVPIRIHDHLTLAAHPAVVHAFGVGATTSRHTVLMRGLDTPVASPASSPDPGTGAVEVTLDSGLAPAGPIRVPGTIGAVAGELDGSSGRWIFTPSDPTQQVEAETFTSALAETARGSRQVLWMGKNNILDVEGVLEDTQRMWDATDDPEHDTLVLGQWPTEHDPVGSATANALAAVNAEQRSRYGAHFLDLGALLTQQEGLGCSPLAPLDVLAQGSTQESLALEVVPPILVASDAIHLNGWGNLAVNWAIIHRMRELRWL